MEIKKLHLKNFRCFDDAEFTFSHVNHIFGDNGTGKSSIAEGIILGLYGTSFYGSSHRLDLLIKNIDEPAEAAVTIIAGGSERVIRRTLNIVRKPGKPEKTETEVFLDGVKVSQKMIQEKLLGRLNVKQFLIGFAPMYYDTLGTSDLEEVVLSLAIPPSRKEVLEKLSPEQRELLENGDLLDKAALKKEIKELEDKKIALTAQVELLKKQLAEKTSSEQLAENLSSDSSSEKDNLKEMEDRLASLQKEKDALENSLGSPL